MSCGFMGDAPPGLIEILPCLTQNENDYRSEVDDKNHRGSNSISNATAAGARRIRRAFSIPRYPFRMSQRSRNSNNNIDESSNNKTTNEMNNCEEMNTLSEETQVNIIVEENGQKKKRLFRRSSLRKFITRIAQQMTFVNIGVS